MSLTLFEFTFFSLYLAILTISILCIQIYNPGKQVRETLHPETAESVVEEPDSDSDVEEEPFDPNKESFTMVENPMLRHRTVQEESAKPINLEDVD
jgi:hypothetical protein